MFVRIKRINGIDYAYLVENEWTPKGSRQNVTAYLGKVLKVQRQKITIQRLTGSNYNKLINDLIETTLLDYGFQKQNQHPQTYILNDITVDLLQMRTVPKHKPAVLALEQGHFCEQTIAELIRFSKKENPEKTAVALASALLQAGISISTENMVALFESIA